MKPTARETTGDPASSGGVPGSPPAATLDLLSMIPVVKGCLLIEKNFIQGFPLVRILPLRLLMLQKGSKKPSIFDG